jgi:hypothetical protein
LTCSVHWQENQAKCRQSQPQQQGDDNKSLTSICGSSAGADDHLDGCDRLIGEEATFSHREARQTNRWCEWD